MDNNITPNFYAHMAVEMANPDSEISKFIEEFFIDYLLSKVDDDKKQETIDKWDSLGFDEEDQNEFLNKIEPDFMKNFNKALYKELQELFK